MYFGKIVRAENIPLLNKRLDELIKCNCLKICVIDEAFYQDLSLIIKQLKKQIGMFS